MLNLFDWLDLQLFAEGGEGGGEGAATGAEGAVDAGQQRLRELGVPEAVLQKRAKRKSSAPVVTTTEAQKPAETQAAAVEKEVPKEDAKPRYNWDEIKDDPDINKEIQKIVRTRVGDDKAKTEKLSTVDRMLPGLMRILGIEGDTPDLNAIAAKIEKDDPLLEQKALDMGVSVDVARKLDGYDRMLKENQEREQAAIKDKAMRQHYATLTQQGFALKSKVPTFDLGTELKNPKFAFLVQPGSPMSLEEAYRSIHAEELAAQQAQIVAKKTTEQLSNTIQARGMRPQEHGASTQAASVTSFNYKNASREQRDALKREIRAAAAQGRKIYPGQK